MSTSATLEPRAPIGRHGNVSPAEAAEFAVAKRILPGGALGGNALAEDVKFVFQRGEGARFWDTSGNCYVDYVLGSGALVLGHAHAGVQSAVADQATRGTHFFAYLNEPAVQYAERLQPYIRCGERLRFTTSGSESTFNAMRLARAFTGRNKVLKFEGAYHGNHDYAQISTTPKRTANFPAGLPDTAGIPEVVQGLTLVAPFNDLDAARAVIEANKDDLAAVIVEPIQRILSPRRGFLQGLREITARHGVLLIMDEVVTGFRYGLGGAQAYFDVVPDLATYGKIIGGGLPVGGVAGRAEIMDLADPGTKGSAAYVYQNGTLQGHPLGCAAGMATLSVLETPGFYDRLFAFAERLREGLREVFAKHDMGAVVFGEGPMWHFLFADAAPNSYRDVLASDQKRLAAFDTELIRQGVFVLPGTRRFVSSAHGEDELALTLDAFDRACRAMKG
jgi:glutamate-1-semialdehyde 2,1-aminomutase